MKTDPEQNASPNRQSDGLVRTHWGLYQVKTSNGTLSEVQPFAADPDPSDIGQSLLDAGDHPIRIRRPHVRKGWLQGKAGSKDGRRGQDAFVPVEWDEALDLVAGELDRVIKNHGNRAIFGGSYGWASAGRFHHAQSQVHRFLNTIGGYVRHTGSYSCGAAHVIIPTVLGYSLTDAINRHTPSWPIIAANTDLVVMFGGINTKNAQVTAGGNVVHDLRDWLARCRQAGTVFVNISPSTEDAWDGLQAEWVPAVPNTDTALMLAMAHVLESENRVDREFLDRYTTGYERFRTYLLGESDGVAKSADWAAGITNIPADKIRELARRMAGQRCLISVGWSLQRAENGEQPYWMATVLAAMLGQIGLPGGGISYGHGSMGGMGNPLQPVGGLALPQGSNPVTDSIPVARIADMLLGPGEAYRFAGETRNYPDIRLVYWCGGNPFHHHQDLFRLRDAWQRPETIIVNEPWWTPTAKHSDIVLPAATTLERNDIGRASSDPYLIAMKSVLQPHAQARTDYDIFRGLADRLNAGTLFSEDRDERDWLAFLYRDFQNRRAEDGIELPDFEAFWETGIVKLPVEGDAFAVTGFSSFRDDPVANPLPTPSGRIEIFSDRIASDVSAPLAGHPVWIEPQEWAGSPDAIRFPIHLLSPQPKGKLHSQLDFGRTSRGGKRKGREVACLHPETAMARGIRDGDAIRIHNDRGACLAVCKVSEALIPNVVSLPTGAWFDPGPAENSAVGLDRHGNPNVLTRDVGTSEIAQGCSANSTLVEVEKFTGNLPDVEAFNPPNVLESSRSSSPGGRGRSGRGTV